MCEFKIIRKKYSSFIKIQLPLYRQLPSGCGLSTFLMLINPEKNEKFQIFLDDLYEEIEFLIPKLSYKFRLKNEYKWSVVLDYLLLKSLGDNILNDYLTNIFPEFYEYYEDYINLTLNSLQIKKTRKIKRLPPRFKDFYNSFFDNYLVNPYIIEKNLFTMRIDMDLKVLFTLFGGKFLPQKLEFSNGKGAICFTKNDFRLGSNIFEEKFLLIKGHLQENESDNFNCIALNVGHHWTAVNFIEDNIIYVNDPATGKNKKVKINKRIPQRYSFYFFEYNPESAIVCNESSKEFLLSETEKELKQIKNFLRRLVDKFEEDNEPMKWSNNDQ